MGVDAFFVISGFLITRILLHDVATSSFSLLAFYKRRALRIIPALTVVLIVTTIASMVLLLPAELLDYSRSLINASLSISNIYFWHSIDYFGRAAWHMPLLHTWSLAIEEQFYLVYPILFWLFHSAVRLRLQVALLCLILLSLAASMLVDRLWSTATFYLLPTRAWELGIGCLLATLTATSATRAIATLLSVVGALLLIAPMVWVTPESVVGHWPKALPACLGTALMIRFGDRSPVGQGLSLRPMVFIGLVSYSLYLWHWPILVLARLHYGDHLPAWVAAGAVGLAVAFSVASYHWVERPFRSEAFRRRAALPVVFAGAVCLGALTVSGYMLRRFHDRVSRIPAEFAFLEPYLDYNRSTEIKFLFREGVCQLAPRNVFMDYDPSQCLPGPSAAGPYLVVGDSYGGHLWRGLSEAYPEKVVGQATAVGHRPLLEHRGSGNPCQELYRFIFDVHLPSRRYETVFLAGRWQSGDLAHLPRTIRYVRKYCDRVVVLGPMNEYEGDLPKLMIRAGKRGDEVGGDLLKADRFQLDRLMKSICEDAGAAYVSLYEIVCGSENGCTQLLGDVPMQYDFGHLTLKGSRSVGVEIRARLDGWPAQKPPVGS